MNSNLNRKILVLGIIVSFIGAGVVPSLGEKISRENQTINNVKIEDINQRSEITVTMLEWIQFGLYGTCQFTLEMTIPSSPFSDLYKRFLNFTGEIQEPNAQDIPESITLPDTLILGTNVTNETYYISPSVTPVREQLINGIIQEHNLSLGLDIYEITSAKMWGVSGVCVINVSGSANYQSTYQTFSKWNVLIGPTDIDSSFNRAGFILTKIGYIQEMLNSTDFTGFQTYVSTWTTNMRFIYEVTNYNDLLGESWSMDFGNGTTLTSFVVPGYYDVVLQETMTVNKSEINATPEDLLENDFLCYKVFKVQFGVNERDAPPEPLLSFPQIPISTRESRGFDPTWSVDLINETYSLPIYQYGGLVDVSLDLGLVLTKDNIQEFFARSTKHGFHVGGEGGYFDTFVVEGPLLKHKIELAKSHDVFDDLMKTAPILWINGEKKVGYLRIRKWLQDAK